MDEIEKLRVEYTELHKRLMVLDKRIDDLDKKSEDGEWIPNIGDECYFITNYGTIGSFRVRDEINKFRLQTKNYFRNKKDADTWLDVHNFIHEQISYWKPWDDALTKKYYFFYCADSDRVSWGRDETVMTQGVTYMPKYVAEAVYEKFTQDELKIWMGVKR